MRICPRCNRDHDRNHTYCLDCHLAYNREWRRRNPGYKTNAGQGSRGEMPEWRAANPEKERAHRAVYRAVKSGKLTRPEECSKCGGKKPQAHHDDYDRPLDVRWLCARCHGLLHAQERSAA